jgi:iron complex outermembrane receptor protein
VRKFELSLASAAVSGAGLLIGMAAAHAQSVPEAGATVSELEEVVVTARRRDETLHDVPLSISVFSAENLQDFGATNLEDISVRTPGLMYSVQAGQDGGRTSTAIRFRGMDINTNDTTQQLATAFIDGIPVMGGLSGIGFEDVQRVEVIKGPQSAFFGRSTFGGAVNYITKDPGDEYEGRLTTKYAQQGLYDISLAHEGPIIPGKLFYRVTGRKYHTDGPELSPVDHGKMGEENTDAVQLTLLTTPTDNLRAKARFMAYRDEDGGPYAGFIGNDLLNCWEQNGGPLFTPGPDYAGVGPVDYFCGPLPYVPIANNTTLPPEAQTIFIDRQHPYYDRKEFKEAPRLDHVGLKREAIRASLAVDYTFPGTGLVLSSITGYNKDNRITIADYDSEGEIEFFASAPRNIEDFFQELRLSSSGEGRFDWMAGLSYYEQETNGLSLAWMRQLNAVFPEGAGDKKVATPAVFGSLNFDITDQFNLSLEGRYQEDELDQGRAPNGQELKVTFSNFTPRVILQYTPTAATNLYVTYAEGNKPGQFNSNMVGLNERELQDIKDQVGGTEYVPEEELANYEMGWKQHWLDNRLSTNFAAYFMQWTNQQTRVQADVFNPDHPNANPVTGTRPIPVLIAAGKTDLWGVEADATFMVTRDFDVGLTFGWAASEYKEFTCGFVERFTGSTDCAGNESPRFPEYSGSAYARYQRTLASDWTGFIRGEAVYFGEAFIDESNLAWTKAYTSVQLRLGAEKDMFRVELWANNLFDKDFYIAGARETDFTNGFDFSQQGALVTPGLGRQVGLTATFDF